MKSTVNNVIKRFVSASSTNKIYSGEKKEEKMRERRKNKGRGTRGGGRWWLQ